PGDPDPDTPDQIEIDGEMVKLRSDKYQQNIDTWRGAITKHTAWIDPNEYHRAALPLDIGLCPLNNDDFCLAKSDVKAIEYTISGAAVVAQNNSVYNRNWKHEVNCLLAGSPREMAEQTIRLIRDPQLRYELVTAAQEYVLKERGLKQMQEEWRAALDG